jgi:hypothetical protein
MYAMHETNGHLDSIHVLMLMIVMHRYGPAMAKFYSTYFGETL